VEEFADFHAREDSAVAATCKFFAALAFKLRLAVRGNQRKLELRRNFSFPATRFYGMMLSWANDAKRVNAQFNFYFNTT
jgi:hypothetical protein